MKNIKITQDKQHKCKTCGQPLNSFEITISADINKSKRNDIKEKIKKV